MTQKLVDFLKGAGVFVLIIAFSIAALFLFVLFFGEAIRIYTTYLSALLDYLSNLALLLSFVFLFLCIFRKCRIFAGTALVYCSYFMAIDLWFQSLINTDVAFGLGGVFVGVVLLGVGIYLTGLVALLWAHLFGTFLYFVMALAIMFGIRLVGLHIAQKEAGRRYESDLSEPDEDENTLGALDDATVVDVDRHLTAAKEQTEFLTPEEQKELNRLIEQDTDPLEDDKSDLADHAELYAAMVVSKTELLGGMFPCIAVYLINDSDLRYPSVKVLTGAFCSIGDDLMETGKGVTEPVVLEGRSSLEIGASDTGELDFIVWYDLDLTDGETYYRMYRFSLPKTYEWDKYPTVMLPFVGEEGMVLPLMARNTGTIDDYVQKKGLAPKYFECKDGEMIQTE